MEASPAEGRTELIQHYHSYGTMSKWSKRNQEHMLRRRTEDAKARWCPSGFPQQRLHHSLERNNLLTSSKCTSWKTGHEYSIPGPEENTHDWAIEAISETTRYCPCQTLVSDQRHSTGGTRKNVIGQFFS
ncbi:hypothetical protein HispidOSU_019187 [Sigmodon hispidus]